MLPLFHRWLSRRSRTICRGLRGALPGRLACRASATPAAEGEVHGAANGEAIAREGSPRLEALPAKGKPRDATRDTGPLLDDFGKHAHIIAGVQALEGGGPCMSQEELERCLCKRTAGLCISVYEAGGRH